MAILQSCCCWRSLRKGCYACASYTLVYYTLMGLLMALVLHAEREYLQGDRSAPRTSSFLEPKTITHTSLVMSAVWVGCSIFGVFASLLLLYGVYRDNRLLLVPWILNMMATILLDVAQIISHLTGGEVKLDPANAMLFTMAFFVLCLNLYSLLCVISQYQEYKAGRGTADHHRFLPKAAAVRYASRPTATSLLSSRKGLGAGAAGSATPSTAAGAGATLGAGLLPTPAPPPLDGASQAPPRKHVQFPCGAGEADDGSPPAPLSATSADEADGGSGSAGGSVVVLLWPPGSSSATAGDRRPGDTAPLITGGGGGSGGGGGGGGGSRQGHK